LAEVANVTIGGTAVAAEEGGTEIGDLSAAEDADGANSIVEAGRYRAGFLAGVHAERLSTEIVIGIETGAGIWTGIAELCPSRTCQQGESDCGKQASQALHDVSSHRIERFYSWRRACGGTGR